MALHPSIQKNIIQIDPIFFYIDIDILLTLGDDGYNSLKQYGGRIDHIKPVDSLWNILILTKKKI